MAKEKIGIRFFASAETDLNIQTENESHAVFFMGEVINGHLERGMKNKIELHFPVISSSAKSVGTKIHALQRSIVGFQLLHSHQLFG